MARINTTAAHAAIATLQPFTSNGAISAEFDGGAYVVKSYATAIAVLYPEEGRAVLNWASYSVTTSKHQAQAARGIAALGLITEKLSDPEAFSQATGYRARLRGANRER